MTTANTPFLIPDEDLDDILEESNQSLSQLNGSRIFITGGTGFFGKWLLASLIHARRALSLSLEIDVISRSPEDYSKQWPNECKQLNLFKGDILRPIDYSYQPDFIIHGAAETKHQKSARQIGQDIVTGAENIVTLAQSNPHNRTLFLSSGSVYDALNSRSPILETDSIDAGMSRTEVKDTATGKQLAESLLQHGSNTLSARCFSFIGPHLPLQAHYAAGNFIGNALRQEPIVINGDGKSIRSYMYPSDLASWLWKLLLSGEPGQQYNIGSDVAVSIVDLAHLISQLSGENIPVDVLYNDQTGARPYYIPDISRCRNLGLKLNTDLDAAILKTLAFARQTGMIS